MNAITLPELDPDLEAWLSRRAAAHGVSPEDEVAAILRTDQAREVPAAVPDAATWDRLLPQPVRLPPGSPSSTDIIRQMRDER